MSKKTKTLLIVILFAATVFVVCKYESIATWFRKTLSAEPNYTPTLSRLFLYYNERMLGGNVLMDEGANMRDIGKALQKYGVCSEDLYPYITTQFAAQPSEAAYADAIKNTIKSYNAITDLQGIKQSIAIMLKPVLMGMDIYESFESDGVSTTGIIPIPALGEKRLGGHAVLVVGYDDTKQWLICRNSWGATWGNMGYFYLPYDYFNEGRIFDCWVLNN